MYMHANASTNIARVLTSVQSNQLTIIIIGIPLLHDNTLKEHKLVLRMAVLTDHLHAGNFV